MAKTSDAVEVNDPASDHQHGADVATVKGLP